MKGSNSTDVPRRNFFTRGCKGGRFLRTELGDSVCVLGANTRNVMSPPAEKAIVARMKMIEVARPTGKTSAGAM